MRRRTGEKGPLVSIEWSVPTSEFGPWCDEVRRWLPMPEQHGADLGALSDLCTPWCVHVVATLRIADNIAAGKDQIGDLAAAAGCDPYALHRVLTYLVGKGVFEESTPGRFALNQAA